MVEDLTGRKYGKLTVLNRDSNTNAGDTTWVCLCECGNIKTIRRAGLVTGRTKSCGCLLSESSKNRMINLATKHGKSSHKLYRVWASMKGRCLDKGDSSYSNYGGRGISICHDWMNDFNIFYNWAISNGYRDGLSIDRINNDGNYEPSNCRWATAKTQCRNTRKSINVKATFIKTGVTKLYPSISAIVEDLSLSYSTCERACHGKKTKYSNDYQFVILK